MTYSSFDPRVAFRENLGTLKYDEDANSYYCFTIKDKYNSDIKIPIYLSEEIKSGDEPNFPYIVMHIPEGGTTYEPQDVGAATRKMETFIEVHIYFTDLDNIDRTEFAKKIKNELHDKVRSNQSTTTGIDFMNVEDDGLEKETDGRRIYFHYLATLYCLYYDLC